MSNQIQIRVEITLPNGIGEVYSDEPTASTWVDGEATATVSGLPGGELVAAAAVGAWIGRAANTPEYLINSMTSGRGRDAMGWQIALVESEAGIEGAGFDAYAEIAAAILAAATPEQAEAIEAACPELADEVRRVATIDGGAEPTAERIVRVARRNRRRGDGWVEVVATIEGVQVEQCQAAGMIAYAVGDEVYETREQAEAAAREQAEESVES